MSAIDVPRCHELNLESLAKFNEGLSKLAAPYVIEGSSEIFVNPIAERALVELRRQNVYEDNLRPLVQLKRNHDGSYNCSVHLCVQSGAEMTAGLEVFRYREKAGMSGAAMLAIAANEAFCY